VVFVAEKDIKTFEVDGAIIIRSAFNGDWLE